MLRGIDSSGIASINTTNSRYDFQKLPVSGNYFITDKAASSLISDASLANTITMCHVRAATVGSVTTANAHPFLVEDGDRIVIGTHNGTLTGWANQKNGKYYSVDSEWGINHIADNGIEAFKTIRGAYCFVWWDSDSPTTLNIARNNERPMYVVMLKSGGMAYASEAGMLYWLLERHNVKMDGPIIELKENFWYKFDVTDPADFDKIALPDNSYAFHKPAVVPAYHTVMSKVKEIIDKTKTSSGGAEEQNKVVNFRGKHPNVSQAEHDAARNLNLIGATAYFTPYMDWSDGIEGTAIVSNSELSASVRGYDSVFDSDEMWSCTVIGVQDDENEMMLILGHPTDKVRSRVGAAH